MDDFEDSRTATAGRKRDFQEAVSYAETDAHTSDEPSRKRLKDDDFAHAEGQEASVLPETSAPAIEDESAGSSRLPAIQGSSIFTMLKESPGEGQVADASMPAAPSSTWNTGVATGLRTSFGSKPKGKAIARALRQGIQMDEIEQAQPFKAVSKKQRAKFSQEEREAHDKALRIHQARIEMDVIKAHHDASATLTSNTDLPQQPDSEGDHDGSGTDDDAEEVDDSDLYQAGGQRIVQHPQPLSDDMLAAFGRPPVPPPYFQKLSPAQKKKMTKQERRQYRHACGKYGKALNEYRIALREYDAKLGNPHPPRTLPPDFEKKPKRLTKREVSELSVDDQELYQVVFGAALKERKQARKDKKQQDAENALKEVGWPLPDSYRQITAQMKKGYTWYPSHRHEKHGILPYTCKAGAFEINEIFDAKGLPILVQEFSYNVFLPEFLTWNRNLWDKMDQKILRAAFNKYLMTFYSHVPELEAQVKLTFNGPDAMTLAAAKEQIQKTFESGSSSRATASIVDAEMTMSGPADTTMQDNPPHQSTISTSNHAPEQVVEPDVHTGLDVEDDDAVMNDAAQSQVAEKTTVALLRDIPDTDIRNTLVFLQNKYFPSASDELRCLTCAQLRHMSDSCPSLNCKTCGVQGKHSTVMCPRIMPCGKCRAKDHAIDDCPEKLAMPRSEMACDLCDASSHLETECPQIWRSYEPSNEVFRVSGIPVYCYSCGDADHYGPDCNMYQGLGVRDLEYTFTGTNLYKYLDHQSQRRAISASIDYSIVPKANSSNGYSIKGKGKGRANDPIELDESDEEDFIRPSVRSGNVPRANINFGNGKPPQAPSRSGNVGRNQITVSIRGGRGRGGGRGNTGRGGGGGGGRGGHTSAQAATAPQPKKRRKRSDKDQRNH